MIDALIGREMKKKKYSGISINVHVHKKKTINIPF